MTRLVLIICLLVPARALWAADVSVLSGEHASFTRLTFSIPDGLGYDVTGNGQKIRIAFTASDPVQIDDDRIFNRIGRDRVSDAKAVGPDVFEIGLACDCTFSEFFQEPNLLVIDIRDAPDSKSTAETVEPDRPVPTPEVTLPLREGFTSEGTKEIAQAISRSITRGVLDQLQVRPEPDTTAARPSFGGSDYPSRNMSIPADLADKTRDETVGKACLPIAESPFPGEIAAEGYHRRYGALTARLYRESGSVNPKAALELARVQLAFGLATEAIATLRLADPSADDVRYILEFSQVVAERGRQTGERLKANKHCGNVALLAAVLADSAKKIAPQDTQMLLAALEEISRPLLKVLGPRLTAKLVDSGLSDTAQQSLRLRKRALPHEAPRLADITVSDTPEEKEEVVRDIAGSNDVESVDAAVSLVENATRADQELSAGDTALVSSLAFENRKTSAAETIAKAEIYALASRRLFDAAFEKLDETDLPDKTRAEALSYLLTELSKFGDDVEFLKHAVSRLDSMGASVGPKASENVARRLFESGFGTLADKVLAKVETPSDALLRGMIQHAAARGDVTGIPADLLKQVQSLEDPGALYRLALLQSDFDRAAELAPTESTGQSLRAIMALEDPESTPVPDPDSPDAPLKTSQNLAEGAREMVARIEAALELEPQTLPAGN